MCKRGLCLRWAGGAQSKGEGVVFVFAQCKRLVFGQVQARGCYGSFYGKLSPATVYQYGQLYAGRAAKVEYFIERSAYGAACVEYVINEQDMCAIDFKGQGGLCSVAQATVRKVVAEQGG